MAAARLPLRAAVRLGALLLLCAAGVSGVPVTITTVAQLAAFAAHGGTGEGVLSAHLVLTGSRIELASNATLTLRGDAAACGPPPATRPDAAGLCVIDADATSQHFVVSDGASLTLDGLALVNGATSYLGAAVCVGVCAPEGNAGPGDNPLGASLAVFNSLLGYSTAGMPGVTSPGGCINVDVLSTLDIVNSTLRHCVAYGTGGAISVQDSQLSITNSTIEDSGQWGYTTGGALYITQYWYEASATFDTVTFSGNAASRGGAIFADWGSPKTVISCVGCVFDGNLAGIKAGAIYAAGSVLDFSNSVFSNNRVEPSFNDYYGQATTGGAILLDPYPALGEELYGYPPLNSSLALRGCTLSGNTVNAATGSGGGVYVSDVNPEYPDKTASSVLIEDSVVSGNVAAQGGGLFIGAGGSLLMARTTVSANHAAGSGAGVAAGGAGVVVSVADSSFTANAAGVAGAALWANGRDGGGELSVTACTFENNVAGGHGGALSAENLDSATLDGCTFRNNSVTSASAAAAATSRTLIDVALQFVQTTSYGAGAGGALFATSAGVMQLRASNVSFAGNAAAYGGGAALLSGVNATLSGCRFASNAASAAGGALQLDAESAGGNTTLSDGTALAGNTAPLGGAIALSGAHALLAAGVSATGGAATYGAVIHAGGTTLNAAVQLLLPGLTASGNAASAAGGVLFLAAPVAGQAVPACATGCGSGNTAGKFGPGLASAPVRFALQVAASTRSAAQLPLAAVAYDAFGTVVSAWAQLTASVACFDAGGAPAPGAVSGAAPAAYAGGAASFGALALAGAVGARYTLAVTLTSPSAAAFAAGMTVNASVAVAQCDASELFEVASLRCVCRDNSVRLSATDDACVCVPGFFWDGAAAECATCPDGVACEGGLALTAAGFWRVAANDTTAYECAGGRCLAVHPPHSIVATGRRLQQASLALAAANCSEGHTGPLCAVCCSPGVAGCAPGAGVYAYQGDACVACPAGQGWDTWSAAQQGVLLAFVIAASLATLFFLFFLPLLPGASEALLRLYSRALSAWSRVSHALFGSQLRDKAVELRLAENNMRARSKRLMVTADPDAIAQLDAAPLDAAAVKHERRKRNFLQLQKAYEQATRPLKILINFWQVCMSFPTTLHLTWPSFFTRLASRLSVVNVHLLSLPSLACLHAEPSAFSVFNGYTLGCAAAVALVGAIFALGAVLHVGLRGGSLADKRFGSFTNRCVTVALVVLYLAYPSVSQVVISMFNCQEVGDAAFLRTDFRVQCYTARHNSYMKAAVFWIFIYPIGVPLCFWAALRYYGVPAMARQKVADAWLHACCDHAARHANLQTPPDIDMRRLTTANISAEYVAALHALFCGPPGAGSDAEKPGGSDWSCSRRSVGKAANALEPPGREAQLAELLRWARTCEVLALPQLQWRLAGRLAEEEDTPLASAAPPLPPSPQEKLAENRIGFLFEAYHVECWYWEIVELLRKFLLTGVMSLVSPGSAAQVVMGLLFSFAAVVLYARRRPYSEVAVNRLGLYAQVNIFLFLLVALLLKVKADNANSDSRAYNAIVGTLSLSLLIVPPINKLISVISEDIDSGIEGHL